MTLRTAGWQPAHVMRGLLKVLVLSQPGTVVPRARRGKGSWCTLAPANQQPPQRYLIGRNQAQQSMRGGHKEPFQSPAERPCGSCFLWPFRVRPPHATSTNAVICRLSCLKLWGDGVFDACTWTGSHALSWDWRQGSTREGRFEDMQHQQNTSWCWMKWANHREGLAEMYFCTAAMTGTQVVRREMTREGRGSRRTGHILDVE